MKKLLLVGAVASLSLSSCASHYGFMSDSASLSQANFSYAKQSIKGEATATYILGFGGLARKAIVDDAKQNMLANNPLVAHQTIANLSVNFKTKYFGIYNQTVCTVTADVVEFK